MNYSWISLSVGVTGKQETRNIQEGEISVTYRGGMSWGGDKMAALVVIFYFFYKRNIITCHLEGVATHLFL
jgi:hypothetical protein